MSVALMATLTAGAQSKSQAVILSSARQSLQTHFNENGLGYGNLRVAERLERLTVVSADNGGTVFVNNETGVVLGCSPSVYTTKEDLPCGLKLWIDAANHAIKNGNFSATRSNSYEISEKVNSFVNTQWNQTNPYNMLCPKGNNSETCLTGCVATAMAQVMKHYEYPASGTGSGSYSLDWGQTYETVSISGVYDWASMKNSYADSFSDEEANAVATLMRDCGYSTNMLYTPAGSSTTDAYIPHALAYNFGYDSLAVNYLNRNYTSDETWYSTIYSELTAKRPVIFSGQSATSGGHCFVLDGVDTNGDVHVNWGWGGMQDGFYNMDVFKEDYDFITEQSVVYGFNPQPTAENVTPTYQSHIIVTSPQLTSNGTNLYLSCAIYNDDWRDFNGDIYLRIADTNDSSNAYKIIVMNSSYSALPFNMGWRFSNENLNRDLTHRGQQTMTFDSGTYEVSFVCKGTYDNGEKIAITEGGSGWKQKFVVDAHGFITIEESAGISTPTIDSIFNDKKAYDLNGKLVSPNHKGIIITNGRKIFNK